MLGPPKRFRRQRRRRAPLLADLRDDFFCPPSSPAARLFCKGGPNFAKRGAGEQVVVLAVAKVDKVFEMVSLT